MKYNMLSSGVRNVRADHAASHVGKAHGFATLVRAIPFHARRRNVYLPYDLMIKVRSLVYKNTVDYVHVLGKSKCSDCTLCKGCVNFLVQLHAICC